MTLNCINISLSQVTQLLNGDDLIFKVFLAVYLISRKEISPIAAFTRLWKQRILEVGMRLKYNCH